MEGSRRKTFWDYLRTVVITIVAIVVVILVVVAIWGGNQPVTLELAYVRGLLIGAAVGFILRCLISKERRNK
jgi:quinol-cytochrome oxidoreductase complex cytochrome b subunit